MMQKKLNNIISVILILAMIFPYFAPIMVKANSGQTIQDMRQYLQDLNDEKTRIENAKDLTQAEIDAVNNNIYNMRLEQEEIEIDIEEANVKIAESEAKIEQLNKEIEALLRYYQLTKGDDIYSDYISDAKSIQDLVRRLEAVDQITEYTDKTIDSLNILIEENTKLKEELNQRTIELDSTIIEISKELDKLNGELSTINDVNLDIDSQIKNQENLIKYYVGICPSETVNVSTCTTIGTSYGWLKPTTKGYITSSWGVRISPITGKVEGHAAVDVGGVPEGTTIYATANGRVSNVTFSSCGGNMVFVFVNVNGIDYTLEFAHLLTVNVKEGQTVDTNTVIGKMGGGSTSTANGGYDRCTTGTHLHYNVSKGHYGVDYSSWSTYLANSVNTNSWYPSRRTYWYSR